MTFNVAFESKSAHRWLRNIAEFSSSSKFFPLAKYHPTKDNWYQQQRTQVESTITASQWQNHPRRPSLEAGLDYRWPGDWFPLVRARRPPRTIHLHVGPTNSGKTHYALERLKQVQRGGVYCAPLRLLAMEMWERLNAAGLPCGLRTGELSAGSSNGGLSWKDTPLLACTVEMVDLSKAIEVAVIDEIQLLADDTRGWAFSQALLGLNADHLYLCGEEAAIPLVQKIAQMLGEEVCIKKYERLSPLIVSQKSLDGNLQKLRPGDCVVSFSRKSIFNLKEEIESTTGRRCAVVYGSLPVDNRTLQARKFNAREDGFELMVASDAIGMGLNLNIQRIVFAEVFQASFEGKIPIPPFRVKQIAGRAGRYKMIPSTVKGDSIVGEVTCLKDDDLAYVRQCMETPNCEYMTAGLQPLVHHYEKLARNFTDLPFHAILEAIASVARFSPPFVSCISPEMRVIAYSLQDFPSLTIAERLILASAPVRLRCDFNVNTFRTFVEYIASGKPCPLAFDMKSLANPHAFLSMVESFYQALDLYLWLSTRFEHIFVDRAAAEEKRDELSALISKLLTRLTRGRKGSRLISDERNSNSNDDDGGCGANTDDNDDCLAFKRIIDKMKKD